MKNLILKELKLNVKPPVFLLSLLGAMVLIPNYPIIVGMGYCVMQIFIYLQISQANLSQEFTSTLPVKRSDIVGSIVAVVATFQLITLLVGAICAPVAMVIYPTGDIVGLDANLAFFGIAFACFAVFNTIFLPNYFKTGYKYGLPLLLGLVGFVVTYGICETLVQVVPSLTALLDGYATQGIWARAVVLAAGMVAYALCTAFATKRAVKKFEKVSL